MTNLSPHQFGAQLPMFDATHMRFPHAPATGPQGGLPKPNHDALNKHGVYIRFGDWPENERSRNWAIGGHEHGVSVYDMEGKHYAEPLDPDPEGNSENGDTAGDLSNRQRRSFRSATYDQGNSFEHHDDQDTGNRGHFVKGNMVGVGHDGEPLLRDVQHVGAWPQHAHRFAPGIQFGLFPERGLRRNG